jgi:hypothetical protein
MFVLARALAGALILALVATVAHADMEVGIDRPGGDYANFDLPENDAGSCELACLRNNLCRAWTYVKPGVQGPRARCWLKTYVPDGRRDGCCVSGTAHSMEFDHNRPGNDLADFDLEMADPGRCRTACLNMPRCRAWTFVKPGVQGPKARCWLKSGTPRAASDNCCVSGLK